MGEARRRARLSVPETEAHRRVASRIDAKIRQLEARGLIEVEILPAMADDMPDFHRLVRTVPGAEMDALCAEFTGFYRFAKILETLASGIASGKIQVPGGRTVNEEHRLAAAIDLRVRQLEAQGMRGAALLEHMVGHILDLQRLWSTTSDETLAFLCREYPGLYRYGILMEEAAEAENKKAATAYGHVPELPASLKTPVAQLLTKGAALERGFQTVLDAREPCDMWVEIYILEDQFQEWTAQRASLSDAFRSTNMPEEAYGILMLVFEPMAQRIDQLHRRVIAKRH